VFPFLRRPARPAWLLLLLGVAGVAFGSPADSAWQVRVWQAEGLTDANIRGVAQTPDGFIWVATSFYFARFDGVQFEKFSQSDLAGLAQKIRCLLASHDGALWLALEDGPVVCLRPGGMQIFNISQPHALVRTLVEDREGSIWVSYDRGSVYRIQDGKLTQVPVGLPEVTEVILATDRQGRVWFASFGQVGLFRNGKFEVLLHLDDRSTRLTAAADGGMWICSGMKLLKYHEGESPELRGSIRAPIPAVRATTLLESADGSVWIGTQTGGLLRYDGSGFESIPASHRTINSLMEDRSGNLWAATGAGLTRVRPRAITVEGGQAGLPSEAVQSLCEDTSGGLWASTKEAFLVRRALHAWQAVSLPDEPDFGLVSHLAADPTGGIWIGTRRYKLHRFQDGNWTTWGQTNGLISHTITALCVSRTGEAWVAGEQPTTLACVQSGKVRLVQLPPAADRIWAMTEDGVGNIWAAGDNGTLLRIRDGVVTDESIKGTNAPIFRCLLATGDGALWLGSGKEGIARLKNGNLVFIAKTNGLYSDHISQIVADQRGWLWLGSDDGIFKVRQDELDGVAEGRLASLHSVRVGEREDLPGLRPSLDDWGSAIRSRDGRLWMPAGQALAIIDPGKFRDDLEPVPVLIRQVRVDDQTVAQYHGTLPMGGVEPLNPRTVLRLPPGHRRLEFEFTALSFRAPEDVRFRFRLEGFDNRWIEVGPERSASYSRLSPGKYRFRVKACGSNGVWNEAGASVELTVAPFIWQTWWFRLASLVAFTAAVAAVVRYVSHRRLQLRLRQLRQQTAVEQERSRIARDLHDDLGSRLTRVVLLNELTVQKRIPAEGAIGHAEQISTTVREIIQSLDETVWALNPRNDTLPHLINYISQFAIDLLKIAGVRCRLDLPAHPPSRTVPVEARHNLFLAVKEALTNALRHGRPTEVRLQIAVTETSLVFTIEDNGQGFAGTASDPGADGLRNMRTRMEEVGGRFQIESVPDTGTRVTFTLPWRDDAS